MFEKNHSNAPKFICIGAQKAGTTWLLTYLITPKLLEPRHKEIHFFDQFHGGNSLDSNLQKSSKRLRKNLTKDTKRFRYNWQHETNTHLHWRLFSFLQLPLRTYLVGNNTSVCLYDRGPSSCWLNYYLNLSTFLSSEALTSVQWANGEC